MAKTGLTDLYQIMRDQTVGMRQRINAAVSASRVEALSMPDEAPPEAIVFLRHVIDAEFDNGARFSPQFRRESAAAVSYWERRCKKAELTFGVPDLDEKRRAWRALINGAIRLHLSKVGRWPQDSRVLLGPNDPFEVPAADPETTLSALLLGGHNRQERRRRQRSIDERTPGVWSGTQEERRELIRPLARLAHQRLAQFDLADRGREVAG